MMTTKTNDKDQTNRYSPNRRFARNVGIEVDLKGCLWHA
jgi:hypothetical protein